MPIKTSSLPRSNCISQTARRFSRLSRLYCHNTARHHFNSRVNNFSFSITFGLGGGRFSDCWRHRHHEHYASQCHRTDTRDRHSAINWRHPRRYPLAVFDGSPFAQHCRRSDRSYCRRGWSIHLRLFKRHANCDLPPIHSLSVWLFCHCRRIFRILPSQPSFKTRPH